MINAAAPTGRPRGGSVTENLSKQTPLLAVPRRGPGAGDSRNERKSRFEP
jgi:hypothetical protein